MLFSVFEGGAIPYPKRDFMSEEENEDKADTGASRIGGDNKARSFQNHYIPESDFLGILQLD